jgi:transcriptional regulator with XRE-family HTH domain
MTVNMSVEEQFPEIAGSRLRGRALALLYAAIKESGMTKTQLAKKLGIRKSAVTQLLHSNGNMRLDTLADYLIELGFEADIALCKVGELGEADAAHRAPQHTFLLQSEEPRRQAELLSAGPQGADQTDLSLVGPSDGKNRGWSVGAAVV